VCVCACVCVCVMKVTCVQVEAADAVSTHVLGRYDAAVQAIDEVL